MGKNHGRVYNHTVRRSEANEQTLIELLAAVYPHTSREGWLEHIREDRVTVTLRGAPCDAATPLDSLRVVDGMQIAYHRPPWVEPMAPLAELRTLHDDGTLVVLHKPSGLPVLPSELYYENTVVSALGQRATDSGWSQVPHPAHRLGVGTSGLLLCGIGAAARSALSKAFEARTITKTYRALVTGVISASAQRQRSASRKRERSEATEEAPGASSGADGTFEIACPIGPVPHSSWTGSVHGAAPGGGDKAKHALSVVRVLESDANANTTLVEVRIPTGRPHQIRIHMAYCGHPLVGDPLYVVGGVPKDASTHCVEFGRHESRPPLPRDAGYLLHAWRATLPHPASGELVTFTAPCPPELCTRVERQDVQQMARTEGDVPAECEGPGPCTRRGTAHVERGHEERREES